MRMKNILTGVLYKSGEHGEKMTLVFQLHVTTPIQCSLFTIRFRPFYVYKSILNLTFSILFSRPSGNVRTELPPFHQSSAQLPARPLNQSQLIANSSNISTGSQIASPSSVPSSGRIQTPAVATPAPRIPKEVAFRPSDQRTFNTSNPSLSTQSTGVKINGSKSTENIAVNGLPSNNLPKYTQDAQPQSLNGMTSMIPERDIGPASLKATPTNCKPFPHRSLSGPAKLTIQSIPVKSQPPMLSAGLSKANQINSNLKAMTPNKSDSLVNPSTQITSSNAQKTSVNLRSHNHGVTHDFRGLERVNECHSSSDENRSSGHASMSDTGHGSSSPGGNLGPLPEDRLAGANRTRSRAASTGHSRPRHRGTPAKVPWSGGGLEDIKLAIQHLTMRSQTSTSTYSSLSSSESSEPARRLGRYSSMETVNTNVTAADEFIWVDSHNRLVELQHPPWSQHCILRVIRGGRCSQHSERISTEAVPRLGYLLQRALVRIAREVQRLSSGIGLCSKHEVSGAFKIVLCPALADSCIKSCLRAAAMFSVPGDSALRQSKSSRAGLQLPIGRFHRWMADARLGRFVHEYAAVYLTAGLENLLEEILLQCLPTDAALPLTATGLEHSIASSGDLWGLLQPYAHLNAGRIASGALTMPRWTSQSSIGSNSGSQNVSSPSTSMEPCLLTTCVGNISELKDIVHRAENKFPQTALSHGALIALFYFMRCSQLSQLEGNFLH